MTVSATTYSAERSSGDGMTVSFPTTYKFFRAQDLEVYLRTDSTGAEVLQTLTTHYTVTKNDDNVAETGTVVMVTAPAVGETLVIRRAVERKQAYDVVRGAGLDAESMEGALDRHTMAEQEDDDELDRALRLPSSDADADMTIPNSVDRASKYLGFDANGLPTPLDPPADTTTASPFGAALIVEASASAAKSGSLAGGTKGIEIFDSATLAAVLTALGIQHGTRAARPSASAAGRRYSTSDTGQVFYDTGAAWVEISGSVGMAAPPPTISNNGTDDIDFAVAKGPFRDIANGENVPFASALTKQLDAAWAAGTNQGGLASALTISNTTYHCFAIYDAEGGNVDAGFDTSVTADNLRSDAATAWSIASGDVLYRRCGSITRVSAAITAFTQNGDRFDLGTPALASDLTDHSAAWSAVNLSGVPDAGGSFRIWAHGIYYADGSAADQLGWVIGDGQTDATISSGPSAGEHLAVRTGSNTTAESGVLLSIDNGQVKFRSDNSAVDSRLAINGWIDHRDRQAA